MRIASSILSAGILRGGQAGADNITEEKRQEKSCAEHRCGARWRDEDGGGESKLVLAQ